MAARLTGWHECIKYLLFAFNFLFWVGFNYVQLVLNIEITGLVIDVRV